MSGNTRKKIRVMSYNICSGVGGDMKMDYPRTASVIDAAEPDIIGLQEISIKHHWQPETDPFDVFCAGRGRKRFFGKTTDFTVDGICFPYGIGTMGWDDVEGVETLQLPVTDPDPKAEPRVALILKVAKPFEFYFINTHLAGGPDQLQCITDRVRKMNYLPAVLVGDFNLTPDSRQVVKLQEDWAIVGDGTFTFNAMNPGRKIDYICFTPKDAFTWDGYQVIPESMASDHRPVIVDLYK